MTCESIGKLLSAYADQTLDASRQAEVEAHLRTCEHCAAILADYERFDALLAELPRVEPGPQVRDRLFSAPEYLALLRDLDHADAQHESQPTVATPAVRANRNRTTPGWKRALLPVAAALALVTSGGFLAHGAFSGTTGTTAGKPPMVAIGNPGSAGIPLAAGRRVIYSHDGRLWSAAEIGKQSAQALTPAGVQVIAWAAAPQVASTGSTLIAYIDASGKTHIVRADGQSDTVMGSVGSAVSTTPNFWTTDAGAAVRASLAWSPDGSTLAYFAVNSDGSTALSIVNADVSAGATHATQMLGLSKGALAGNLTWSANGAWLAYTQTSATGTSLWAYTRATSARTQVAAQLDLVTSAAQIGQIAWTGDARHPLLTWSSEVKGAVASIFAWTPGQQTPTTLYSPAAGVVHAAYSTATSTWLVSEGTRMVTVTTSGALSSAATLPAPATSITWNAQGTAAAITSERGLYLWAPGKAPAALAQDIDALVAPAWSADGQTVAFATGGRVAIARVRQAQGTWVTGVHVAATQGAHALAWSPDSNDLAVTEPSGVVLVQYNGIVRSVDSAPADGALAWTVAG